MSDEFYPNLVSIRFKPAATTRQVNALLKSEGLMLHETLRGRMSVQVFSKKVKTVAERNQLISRLQKNPIVKVMEKVVIPDFTQACLVSGGSDGPKGCTWSDPSVDFKKVLPEEIKECARIGAQYRQFPSTCQDECEVDPSPMKMCGAALTMGCDCGPNRCWHRGTCIQNPKPIGPELNRKLRFREVLD